MADYFPPPVVAPAGGALRGVILYLATHDKYIDQVEESLVTLEEHSFAVQRYYPVIVFVSDEATPARLRALEARWIASGFTLRREDLL